VILVVDAAAPWLPAIHKPREDAKVIHLAADPMHGYVPIRGHECDIALACGTAEGLEVLDEALTAHAATAKSKIDARRGKLAERHAELRESWAATLEKVKRETPMHAAWVSHCISQVKDDDTVVIRESALAQPFFKVTQPGTCFNAGAASGLGWGMGAALGAKLATPNKLVIGTEGDGAYMFSNPVSAHYVAAEQDLPILTVMFNNGIWNAVRRSTVGLTPDGYAAKSNRPPATMLDGITKYEKAVEMVDGYGERVTDPDDLIPALERGIKAVMVERRQALINVVCSP
jgi:acetolactate synthase-1/2/3 large subunit